MRVLYSLLLRTLLERRPLYSMVTSRPVAISSLREMRPILVSAVLTLKLSREMLFSFRDIYASAPFSVRTSHGDGHGVADGGVAALVDSDGEVLAAAGSSHIGGVHRDGLGGAAVAS